MSAPLRRCPSSSWPNKAPLQPQAGVRIEGVGLRAQGFRVPVLISRVPGLGYSHMTYVCLSRGYETNVN